MNAGRHRHFSLSVWPKWSSLVILIFVVAACKDATDNTGHYPHSSGSKGVDPGTKAMIDSVQKAQNAVDPMKVTVFMAGHRAKMLYQKIQQTTGLEKINTMVMYGFEELKAGNTKQAISAFEQVLKDVEPMQIPGGKEQAVLEMKKLLALAYLRLGEQENCILNHTSASCIIPIAQPGQHGKKEGSSEAMRLYKEVLAQNPNDLTSIYLLNVASMTLGMFPHDVPASMRLPEGYFDKKVSFPPFIDIAAEMGFTSRGLAGGIALEDFDNDGDIDILTSEWGFNDQIRLFDNDGKGSFIDVTERTGLVGVTGGLNLRHADYNNDGHMDFLILRGGWFRDQGKIPNSLIRNNGDGTFSDVTVKAGIYSKRPTQTAVWADFDLDGWLDLFIGNESIPQNGADFNFPSELFHNKGDDTFEEISVKAGLNINGFVKGSFGGDINNDGLPDLFASILQSPNRLFLNTSDEKGISFKDISPTANIAEPIVSFPTWMFDYNNDGWLDIFVSAYSDGTEDLPAKVLRAYGRTDDPFRPRLYRNNRNMTFTDVSSAAGLTEPAFTMGCNYGDLDNDGFPDFYLATGEPNLKSIVPNKMYWNRDGKTFADVTYAGGFGNIQKGHAVGFADLDKDGDQDMYVVMGGSFEGDIYQDIFFENPIGQDNHWIVLKLEGVTSNKSAIGARVDLEIEEDGQVRHVHEMVTSGASFGGNSLQLEIGVGKATEIKSLTVFWPDNEKTKQVFQNIAVNKAYHLKEGDTPKEISYPKTPFAKQAHQHQHH